MNFRRIMSLVLALLMMFSTVAEIVPATAFAAESQETTETAESTETEETEEEGSSDVVARYEIPMEDVVFGEDGSMYISLPEPTTTETAEPTEPAETEIVVTEPETTEPEATESVATEPETTEPAVTEPETAEPEIIEPLTWFQWIEEQGVDTAALTKEEQEALSAEYGAYRIDALAEMGELPEGATEGSVANNNIEVAISYEGKFTIGTRIGNPSYASDDYQKLLFGHPSPGTSNTLVYIDGSYQNRFYADTTTYSYNTATSTMNIPSYGIKVVQTLKLIKVGSSSFEDTVQIQYQVYNNDSRNHDVGIRIMMDTMLANNDAATYHLTSLGHVTSARVFSGSAIPSTYQFYDNIDNPTTLATGYLYRGSDRKPDKVQFCNWGGIVSSSWNHTVRDGDFLGDSAVGVYFNPVTVKPGKSTTVRTYYGVSVGTASGGSNEVASDEVKLIVKDSYTQEPLEGVNVSYTRNGSTATAITDSDGVAYLSGFASSRNPISTSITLTKDGYKRTSFRTNLRGGSTSTQQMSLEDAAKPVINSIMLDTGRSTVNLLDSTYTVDEDANGFIAENGATGTITIKATSDTENCTWMLVQDAKVIQRNSTGEFTFNVRETTVDDEEKILVEDLTPNGNRYIQCISPDGEKSEKMRFGLKVAAGVKVKFGDFDLGKVWPAVDGKIGEGTLGALFLGNKLEFGPAGGKYKVFAELTEDGTVRVGLNVDVKELGKINDRDENGFSYNQRKDDFLESLRQQMMDYSTGKNKKLKNTVAKPGKFSYGLGEADFVFCGYGEGQLENGSVRVDVTVFFAVKAKGSYTWQFMWGAIPVYIDVGGEAGAKLQASANIMNTEGLGFRFYDATFNPSIKLWLEGGVGVKKVASIGVQGSGTLNVNWDLLDQSLLITLRAAASLVAEAFGVFEKDLTFAEKTVPIYDSNDKEGIYGGEENLFEMLTAQPYRLITREESAEGGTSQYATNARIVTVNGVQYKFFATDRGGDLSNRYMLCWSKLENGSWTEAVPVADDGTSDLYYDVAVSGSDIYVVWSNSGRVFDDETVTLDEFAAAQEICLAVIDSTDGSTSEAVALTNDAIMDTMPAVTVQNGTAYVAWSHTENSMEDMTDVYDNYLYYTAVTGGNAGDIVSVNFEKASINAVSASSASGKPLATIVSNASDEITLEDNVTTVVDMRNGTKTDVDTTDKVIGKAVTGTINGTEKMFWMENGNVAYADSITSENPTYIFSEETIPGSITENNYTVITAGDSTYLIWSQSGGEEGVPATAMTTIYSNGVWSGVHKLTDLTTGNITELDGYLNAEGQLILVYTVKNIYENAEGNATINTNSQEKTVEPEQSVSIASLDFEISDAVPGQILPLKLDVVNTGNTAITSLDVYINSEAGENHRATLTDLYIAPGTNSVVEIDDFCLSSSLTTRNVYEGQYIYTLTAQATGSELAVEETFEIGYDKVVIYKRDTAYVENRENLVLAVENASGFPATNVRVRILADAVDGVLIYDKVFDSIPANDAMTIYLDVEDLDSTSLFATASSDCTAGQDTGYVELILSNPNTGANLTMEAIGCGTVTPAGENIFPIGEPVTIQASPNPGYLFDGWYSNRELVFLSGNENSAYAEIEMPAGNTVVSARFVSETPYDFTLNADSADVYAGDTFAMAAQFASVEETGKVTWSSSDETIATVSDRGVVTALAEGTATITAACGGYVHTCQIHVSYVDVTSIRMVDPTLDMELGETTAAEVLTDPANGAASLRWFSSDESVATVDRKGNVTAVGYGTAVITAVAYTDETVTAECTVSVILPVEDIALDQYEIDMSLIDNQAQLQVVYLPEEANFGKQITWTTEHPEMLNLQPVGEYGETLLITALGAGYTTVTATSEDGHQVSCMVNVRDAFRVDTVEELQSAHYPYDANVDRTWVYTDETKEFMIVRFSEETDIYYGDQLQLMDGDGNIIASNYDESFAGRSFLVEDSTVQIRLISGNNSYGYYGFRVEEIVDEITPDDVLVYAYDVEFTGKAVEPAFEAYCFGYPLTPGEDYTLRFSNNKKVGTADVQFIGQGKYEGITVDSVFQILPSNTQLDATVVSNGIKLSWPASKGAGGYLLFRNVDDSYNEQGEYWTLLKQLAGSAKNFTDQDTNGEHYYCYKLVPYKDDKKTPGYDYMAAETVFGPITKLGPVKNLTAEEEPGSDIVNLSWDALDGAKGYIVYHSENGGEFYWDYSTEGTQISVGAYGTGKHQFKIVPYKDINGNRHEGAASNVVSTYRLSTPYVDSWCNSKNVELYYSYEYVLGQTGIQIERSTNGGESWKSFKTVKCGDYYPGAHYDGFLSDTGAKTSGTTYMYRSRTYATEGKKTYYSDWSYTNSTMFLSAPTIASVVTGKNGGLQVQWKKVPGAQWYEIERWYYDYNNPGEMENITDWVMDPNEKDHIFRDTTATRPGVYEYYVRAYAANPDGGENYESNFSNWKNGYVLGTATLNMVCNAPKGTELNWEWDDFASGYEVWRSTDGVKFTKAKTVNGSVYLNDTGASKNGTVYTYKIRAFRKEGSTTFFGDFSDPMSVCKMTPPKVKSLEVRADGGFDVTFNSVADAHGYEVIRWSGGESKVLRNFPADGAKSYTISDPEATQQNTLYEYVIHAYRNETNGTTSLATSYAYGYHFGQPEVTVENSEKGIMIYASVVDRDYPERSYATSYTVYRSENGGAFKQLKTVKVGWDGKLAYNDTSAKAGKTYSYKVMASGKNSFSAFTAVESEPTAPMRCTPGPKLISLENAIGGITVNWTEGKGMLPTRGYKIYRSQDNLHYEHIATVEGDVHSYTDTTADFDNFYYIEDNMYYYKVETIPAEPGKPAAYSNPQQILYMFAPVIEEVWYGDPDGKTAYVSFFGNGYWNNYEVRYKTGKTTKTVKDTTDLKGLKPGSEYEISVRTVFKFDGKTYYSAWSEPYYLGR